MKSNSTLSRELTDQSGSIIVLVAFWLIFFLVFVGLAIDIGYLWVTRNESQNAADASALAGARQMGENYFNHSDPSTGVIAKAQDTAALNTISTQYLAADNANTQIGTWDASAKSFTQTAVNPFAVRVVAMREEGLTSGPIGTFVTRVIGINSYNMKATAVACIAGTCTSEQTLPLGIGRSWFDNAPANNFCTEIHLNKTKESCAGWTNLKDSSYKQKEVQDILEGTNTLPKITAGQSVQFGGGTTTQILNDLIALFNDKTRYAADKTFNADGSVKTWTTSAVVYDDGGICDNPNYLGKVLGFAKITITGFVTKGPNKGPEGTIQCNIAEEDRGGCFYAGTFGTIPSLVK